MSTKQPNLAMIVAFAIATFGCSRSSSSAQVSPASTTAISTSLDAAIAIDTSVARNADASKENRTSAVALDAGAESQPCAIESDCAVLSRHVIDGGVSIVVLAEKSDDDAGVDDMPICVDEVVHAIDPRGVTTLLAKACTMRDHPLTATLDAGVVDIERDGQGFPSNWVGMDSVRFSTSPIAMLSTEEMSFNRMIGCSQEIHQWDYTTMRGSGSWSASCTESEPCKTHKYTPIPRVSARPAFARDWPKSELGVCATTLDATSEFASGKPTASLRAVLVEDELFVDVTDDTLVTSGAIRDRLEVWTTTLANGTISHCSGARIPRPTKLVATLERVDAGPLAARARVKLPVGTEAIAITYFDTDDGATVVGKIATSALDHIDHETPRELGAPFDAKSRAPCMTNSPHSLSDNAPSEKGDSAHSRERAPLWEP